MPPPAAVLAALPALETVGVYYASWNPNQKDKFLLPKAWAYTPHHIDSFELVEVVNERRRGMVGGTPLTLDDIRACLRSLPSVSTLTITHARWRDDELTTEPEPALPVEPLAALRVHKLSLLSHSMLPSMLPLISMTSSASTMTKPANSRKSHDGRPHITYALHSETVSPSTSYSYRSDRRIS